MTHNQSTDATSVTKKAKLWITLSYILTIIILFTIIVIGVIFLANSAYNYNPISFSIFSNVSTLLSIASLLFMLIGVSWLNRLDFFRIRNAVIKFKLSIWVSICQYVVINIAKVICSYWLHDYFEVVSVLNSSGTFLSSYFLIAATIELRKSASPIAAKYIKRILVCTIINSFTWNFGAGFGLFPLLVNILNLVLLLLMVFNWRKFLSLSDKAFIIGESPKLSFKPGLIECIYIGYIAFIILLGIASLFFKYTMGINYI